MTIKKVEVLVKMILEKKIMVEVEEIKRDMSKEEIADITMIYQNSREGMFSMLVNHDFL